MFLFRRVDSCFFGEPVWKNPDWNDFVRTQGYQKVYQSTYTLLWFWISSELFLWSLIMLLLLDESPVSKVSLFAILLSICRSLFNVYIG